MQQFIEITQDAAGIITEQTNAQYQGLYTSGLETCVAMAIKGTNGVILIHHSGRLSQVSIHDILGEIGDIQAVLMFAHQELHDIRNIDFIKDQNLELFPDVHIPEVIFIDSGCVALNRDFTWNTNPMDAANLVRPLDRDLRLLTNKLNNLVADELEVDVQFDSEHLTACTELVEPIEQTMFRWEFDSHYTPRQREILRVAINLYQRHFGLDEIPSLPLFNLSFLEQIVANLAHYGLDEDEEQSPRPHV